MSEQLIDSEVSGPLAGLPFRFTAPAGFEEDRKTMLDATELAFVHRGGGYRQEILGLPRVEFAKLADTPPPTHSDELLGLHDEVASDRQTESVGVSSCSVAGRRTPVLEAHFVPFDNGRLRGLLLGQREIRLSSLLCPIPGLAETWALIMLGADAPRSGYQPFRQSVLDSIALNPDVSVAVG